MITVIADCETDGLLPAMTKLHCVQIGAEEGDEATLYGDHPLCDAPLAEGLARLRAADRIVGHNFLGFDLFAINRLHPGTVRVEQVADTLVLARMTHITERNHSLDAWGQRTGTLKGKYTGDYQTFDEEFAEYSRIDIHAGRALWGIVKHGLEWGGGKVYEIERNAAYCVALQEQNGFSLDVARAQKLHGEIAEEMAVLEKEIAAIFPCFSRTEEFIPKVNNSKLGYKKGEVFVKRWSDSFNPRSRHHIAEALIRDGWAPLDFTPTGQPQVDADTLRSVDHPGAKLLVRYLRHSKVLGAILGAAKSKGYLQLVKSDGRIYGRVNTLGATTWRMTHSNPNTANVDKDERVRSLFIPRKGWDLVGCDGKEIQARFLAHYLARYDGGTYAAKLTRGDKSKGTDGHSLNWEALKPFGCASRDGAKQAQYAKVFGCRAPRMWETLNEFRVKEGLPAIPKSKMQKVGQGALDALGRSMPGLDDLLRDVQTTGKKRGYLLGIAGGQVPVAAAHAALVSLLQNGEAVAMKLALGIFHFEYAPAAGYVYGRDWAYCSNVHDEVQFEAPPEHSHALGDLFSSCIEEAGRRLNMKCPLGGEAKVGPNWAITH